MAKGMRLTSTDEACASTRDRPFVQCFASPRARRVVAWHDGMTGYLEVVNERRSRG